MSYTVNDWKPKTLPGGIYCARACGGKCTRAAFETATKKAARLAKSMGPGWKPRVWENLGWHYSVVSADGRWKSRPSDKGGVTVYLGHGDFGGTYVEYGRTPKRAMEGIQKRVLADIGNLNGLITVA